MLALDKVGVIESAATRNEYWLANGVAMKKRLNNNLLHSILLLTCMLFAGGLEAADLLQSYQRGQENDPQWAAAKSKFMANSQMAKQGRAGLLPSLYVGARKTRNNYQSDQTQTVFSEDLAVDPATALAQCGNSPAFFNCWFSKVLGVGVSDDVDSTFESTDYTANFRQPIIKMDRWYEYKKTKALTIKSASDFILAEQDLIIRVSKAYFDVLRSYDDLDTVEQEASAILKQLKLVKKRYEQGLERETGLYEAQAAYDLQGAKSSFAQSALQIAYRQLAAVTGVYDNDIIKIADEMPIERPLPATGEEWVQQALAHNASLDAARHSVDAAESEYKKQRSGHLPSVNLFASYKETSNKGGQGFVPGSKGSIIGVEFTMPIYQGGMVSASRKRALYTHQESKDRLTQQRWAVESGTLNLHLTVNSDVERYNSQKRAIASTRNALRSTKKSYQNGSRTIADILHAQKILYNSRREMVHTRFDYIVNTLKLKQAAGVLSVEDLVVLNKWMDYSYDE